MRVPATLTAPAALPAALHRLSRARTRPVPLGPALDSLRARQDLFALFPIYHRYFPDRLGPIQHRIASRPRADDHRIVIEDLMACIEAADLFPIFSVDAFDIYAPEDREYIGDPPYLRAIPLAYFRPFESDTGSDHGLAHPLLFFLCRDPDEAYDDAQLTADAAAELRARAPHMPEAERAILLRLLDQDIDPSRWRKALTRKRALRRVGAGDVSLLARALCRASGTLYLDEDEEGWDAGTENEPWRLDIVEFYADAYKEALAYLAVAGTVADILNDDLHRLPFLRALDALRARLQRAQPPATP